MLAEAECKLKKLIMTVNAAIATLFLFNNNLKKKNLKTKKFL